MKITHNYKYLVYDQGRIKTYLLESFGDASSVVMELLRDDFPVIFIHSLLTQETSVYELDSFGHLITKYL